MATITSLYPMEKLQTLGQQSLSDEDKALLQCAYIWVQTYNTGGPAPPSATASYSELWFILQFLGQLQIVCKDLCHMMPDFVENHKARYNASVGELKYSFASVLHHDFTQLKVVVGDLATLQFNELY